MKKVSVLICSYNSGDYILSTIKSVLNQIFTDFELLILDNASTDNTLNNIKSFQDDRIKVFESKENLGPYGGLNFLLKKAIGEYIAIQDHDDIWNSKKLEKQITFLDDNKNYLGCGTNTVMFYENDEKYFLYYLNEKNYYTIHPSLVFRNIGSLYYDEELIYFGDAYFQKNILCKGEKLIYNLKEPLTFHLIKNGYSNFTFNRFKINLKYLKRIIDIHSYSLYSVFVIFYEILKKTILLFLRKINNYKFYVWFDRLPYRLSGNKIIDMKDCKDNDILEMYNFLK